jgi:hypothetical protein
MGRVALYYEPPLAGYLPNFASEVDKVTRITLDAGDAGIRQTVFQMAKLAREGAVDPLVKDTAIRFVTGVPSSDREGVFQRLLDNVRSTFRYVPDSFGVEQIWTPRIHAARVSRFGFTQADCDDLAVWIAALARSVGFNARFVTIANGRRGEAFNHVFAEVEVRPGEWHTTDFLSPRSPRLRTAIYSI